jgi:DNA polymerase I-like protein with 3'-5' exonuclease and polymerase domains
MLVNADAKALEWLGAVYLSKDKVGYREIRDGIDQHTENQKAFGLPSRLIAKKFVFRLIYGGTAYAYANDPDFKEVEGADQAFWEGVIRKFYSKYEGIAQWHNDLMLEAMQFGKVVSPTGREFSFTPEEKKGSLVWPRTTILNYPVQGFGADLMVLARILVNRRLKNVTDCLPICTVHDSIVYDVPLRLVRTTADAMFVAWRNLPEFFERCFGVPFDLPCKVEVSSGPNWKDMTEVDEDEQERDLS